MPLATHQAMGWRVPTEPDRWSQGPQHIHCTDVSGSGSRRTGHRGLNLPGGQKRAGRTVPLYLQCAAHPPTPRVPSAFSTSALRGGVSLMAEKC